MARVLGLDLGSHTLKAVLLETTMRGHSVKSALEVPMPSEGERPERLKLALSALLARGPLAADTVVVGLPGAASATHSISLPFSDPKKIESTLPFEIESQLPFDLSEAVYDYQVGTTDEKGATVLVGVVRKTELAPLLGALKEAKLDPRIVTHPGLAYQGLLTGLPPALLPASASDAVAFLDLGHERVTIAIGRPGGALELVRTFPGGGAALTRALATEFKVDLPAAEAWKEEHGALASQVVGPDAERAAGALLRAFQPVLRELRPTLKSYNARTRCQVGKLLLCGGTARLRGLDEQLERDLGISTGLVELPNELREAGQGAGPQFALAWALAVRGQATGAKAPRFNLRRGEFAFKSDFDFVKDKVGQLVAFGAVLLVLLIASGVVRNSVLERRSLQVDALLCETTQRILGKCERDYDRALNLMRGQESPAAGIPKRSAATLLAELVSHVPTEMAVTMDQIVVDLDRIQVRCQAGSSKEMEDLIDALKTYNCFKEVKEGKIEKNKDGSKISFRLDVQVECPEDGATPQG